MNPTTAWQDIKTPVYEPLVGSVETDVCIIGGGIAGTTIAYMLAKAGKRVVVVNKGTLDQSVTACTTAFLTRSLDTDLVALKRMFGSAALKQILQSHEDAIDMIERIVKDEHIDCGFERVPHYSIALTKQGYDAYAADVRIANALEFPQQVVTAKTFPFKNSGAVLIPHQGQFHPLKYVAALREKAIGYGAQFYDDTEAVSIDGDKILTIKTKGGSVTAQTVVTATYNPFKQPWWYIFKKGMYLSYVYELAIPKGTVPHGLYEDDGNPYRYFRSEKGNGNTDRLIIGGEDHRIELHMDPDRNFNALFDYVRETFGLKVKDITIINRWTGPILEQTDGLALIGRESKKYANRYVATAFSGNGMTYSTLAGMIIADGILGKPNVYADIYRPSRGIAAWSFWYKSRDYFGAFVGGALKNLFKSKKRKR